MKFFESFKSAKNKAQEYLKETSKQHYSKDKPLDNQSSDTNQSNDLDDLQKTVSKKAAKSKSQLKEGIDDLQTLLRLISAYSSGKYRNVALKSMVSIVGSLIYFVNPLDAIPDFIAAFGFLDDITVLAFVIKTFKDEIDRFIDWEARIENQVDNQAEVSEENQEDEVK